jgi:hypothetical protein
MAPGSCIQLVGRISSTIPRQIGTKKPVRGFLRLFGARVFDFFGLLSVSCGLFALGACCSSSNWLQVYMDLLRHIRRNSIFLCVSKIRCLHHSVSPGKELPCERQDSAPKFEKTSSHLNYIAETSAFLQYSCIMVAVFLDGPSALREH